ncbi:MAG: PIN domain-containing protein [Deltaproteobacteria bacterium]|nr:PIN domain-containing protein [Deltaproteobacteria bacterium]
MLIFADTSALFALLVRNDLGHAAAKANFEDLMKQRARLLTSSYVLLETLTLLQRRVSLEAVFDFNHKFMPLLEVVWVDETWHARALQRLQAERSRSLSLTDCLSFEIMEAEEIDTAFSVDRHFSERGFKMAALQED